MEKNISDDLKQKLRTLITTPFNLLIIEDHELMGQALTEQFSQFFPKANIHRLTTVEWPNFEQVFTEGKYTLVTVNGSLTKWNPHPVFGTFGISTIPFMKKSDPNIIILALSLSNLNNAIAIKNGADHAFPTDEIHEFLRSVI